MKPFFPGAILWLLLSPAAMSEEGDYIRFATLPGNPQLGPDVGCARLRGGGLPRSTESFQALRFSPGPNGVPEDGRGDDLLLGPAPATYSFQLLRHHARYQVDDPAQVGVVDPRSGVFTAGSGLATGYGKVTAVTGDGKTAEAPVFILPPDFVDDPPPRVHHFACRDLGGRVHLEWIPGGPYERQLVYRDGALIATLPGDAVRHDDPESSPGVREYEVVGTVLERGRELESDPTRCVAVARRPRTVQLLWAPREQRMGRTDSAGALREALLENGEEVFEVEEITGVNLRDFRALWAAFGTYPDEHYLWLSEAVELAEYLERDGGRVYIEGADIWGFVPQNAFHRMDGVLDCPPDDFDCPIDGGRADLRNLRGADAGNGLDLSPFAGPLPYFGENMFIDRLVPGPPGAGPIWYNADVGYAAGIAHRGPRHRTIQCSFEFGGIDGDRKEIMRRYLDFLGAGTGALLFTRGDVDGSGQPDISDAIAGLNLLFLGTPLPDCPDALDVNDDGSLDISDPIRLLGFLFLGGAPPPPPFPACGLDPTFDAAACLEPHQSCR